MGFHGSDQSPSLLSLVQSAAKPIGLGASLDDMRPAGDPIQQGFAEARIGNDLRPLREGQVRREDDGGRLGPLGNHLEENLRTHLSERHVADLVDGNEVVAGPAGEDATDLDLLLGFHELVDQSCRGREADPSLLSAGRDTQPRSQMRFPRAAVADKDNGFGLRKSKMNARGRRRTGAKPTSTKPSELGVGGSDSLQVRQLLLQV